jgi:hypothetical protein
MQLQQKTRNTYGCMNLTHYSFCRYCSHFHECAKYRKQYHRTTILNDGDKLRYNKITSYDMTGNILDLVGVVYTEEEIKDQVEYLNSRVRR